MIPSLFLFCKKPVRRTGATARFPPDVRRRAVRRGRKLLAVRFAFTFVFTYGIIFLPVCQPLTRRLVEKVSFTRPATVKDADGQAKVRRKASRRAGARRLRAWRIRRAPFRQSGALAGTRKLLRRAHDTDPPSRFSFGLGFLLGAYPRAHDTDPQHAEAGKSAHPAHALSARGAAGDSAIISSAIPAYALQTRGKEKPL